MTLLRLLIFILLTCFTSGFHTIAQENEQETEETVSEEGEAEEGETEEETPEAEIETVKAVRNPRLDLPPPTTITYAQQDTQDIQRTLEPDHYRTVTVEDKEALFIISEANIALTKGVAIIIGESGRNSLSQHALSELVPSLNDYGWVTILVPAPNYGYSARNGDYLPEKDETATEDAQAPQEDTTLNASTEINDNPVYPFQGLTTIQESDFTNHEDQMLALMQEVVEYSSTYPGFFLVVAQGSSAAWLAKIYSEQKLPQPDALVAISPNWPEQRYNKNLPEYIAQVTAPVLDVYNQWDNDWTKKSAKKRAIAAERALKLHYRQREIIGQPYDKQQFIYLAKEIYGWLTYMGW